MSTLVSKLLQNETKTLVQGPVGSIEAAVALAPVPAGQMLVCHPHPQFAGTMYNKVVTTVIKASQKKGLSTCRFNYRGVGQSQGEYDEGQGEVEDALAVANWFLGQNHGEPLWLTGFSFGAFIAFQAASRLPVKGLILIAPALGRMDFSAVPEPYVSSWVIQGKKDELIAAEEVEAWSKTLTRCQGLALLPDATHQFHGCLGAVGGHIESILLS
jgi:alpha/beta superfamily hydrolase